MPSQKDTDHGLQENSVIVTPSVVISSTDVSISSISSIHCDNLRERIRRPQGIDVSPTSLYDRSDAGLAVVVDHGSESPTKPMSADGSSHDDAALTRHIRNIGVNADRKENNGVEKKKSLRHINDALYTTLTETDRERYGFIIKGLEACMKASMDTPSITGANSAVMFGHVDILGKDDRLEDALCIRRVEIFTDEDGDSLLEFLYRKHDLDTTRDDYVVYADEYFLHHRECLSEHIIPSRHLNPKISSPEKYEAALDTIRQSLSYVREGITVYHCQTKDTSDVLKKKLEDWRKSDKHLSYRKVEVYSMKKSENVTAAERAQSKPAAKEGYVKVSRGTVYYVKNVEPEKIVSDPQALDYSSDSSNL